MLLLTRTDQNRGSFGLSSLWNCRLGCAGFIWRSKAAVLTAFCSSPVSLARLSVNVSAMRKSMSGALSTLRASVNLEYFHHLISEVIDDFHGDASGFWLRERPRRVAIECRPGVLIDFGFKGSFECAVGIVG